MEIVIEPFSRGVGLAYRQGKKLRNFVASEGDHVRRFYPKTASRYHDLPHAVYNVLRLAELTERRRERFSYLVQKRGRTIHTLGPATIILDSKIIDPTNGETIRAHDIDYIVKQETDASDHANIGHVLLKETARLHTLKYGNLHDDPAATISPYQWMVTVDPKNQYPPIGLINQPTLHRVGGPAVLRTELGKDYHQVNRDDAVVQLYVGGE